MLSPVSASLFWICFGISTPGGKIVYHVDLEPAVQRAPEVAALRSRLEKMRSEQEARLRRLPKDASLPSEIERAEHRLEAVQSEGLAPILERLRVHVDSKIPRESRWLAMQDALLIAAPSACDRTKWLVESQKAPVRFEPNSACRVSRYVFINVDRVLRSMSAAQAAAARIQALQDRRQAELDRFRQGMTELERLGRGGNANARREAAALKEDLDRRFAEYQRELAAKEAEEEDRLYVRLEAVIQRTQRRRPNLRFVDVSTPPAIPLAPTCDATNWAIERVDQSNERASMRSTASALPPGCS